VTDDVLAQIAGLARQREPLASAKHVRHTFLARLALRAKSLQMRAPPSTVSDGGKRGQDFRALAKQRDDTAAQVVVEFDSQD
jgi:hypothetical protein